MSAAVAERPKTRERIVRGVVVQYETVVGDVHGHPTTRILTAERGHTVQLVPLEEQRLEKLGMLYPVGVSVAEAEAITENHLNEYRAGRGDREAYAAVLEHARSRQARPFDDHEVAAGGEPDVDSGETETVRLARWLRTEKPTVDAVLAMADGYPERAEALLEAENLATGNTPRKGLEQALRKIIAGGEVWRQVPGDGPCDG